MRPLCAVLLLAACTRQTPREDAGPIALPVASVRPVSPLPTAPSAPSSSDAPAPPSDSCKAARDIVAGVDDRFVHLTKDRPNPREIAGRLRGTLVPDGFAECELRFIHKAARPHDVYACTTDPLASEDAAKTRLDEIERTWTACMPSTWNHSPSAPSWRGPGTRGCKLAVHRTRVHLECTDYAD